MTLPRRHWTLLVRLARPCRQLWQLRKNANMNTAAPQRISPIIVIMSTHNWHMCGPTLDVRILSQNTWRYGNPRLVELIDRYRTAHGVSESEVARRIGMSRENLRKWRINGVSRLPDRENLAAVARVIGKPYREVVSAALFDTGYLTDDQASTPRPHDEVLHDTISVLTEATRLTNQPMRQATSGQWEVDPDPRAALRIDWAAFVTLALAGAAANVGSIEEALAGRPGSWEAEMVRRTLQATVFDDKDLLRHRTEPVVVDLWVESILAQLDDGSDDAYADAQLELDARADAIPEPTDLPPGPFSQRPSHRSRGLGGRGRQRLPDHHPRWLDRRR